MISVAVRSDGPATRAWELLSEPARWPEWSPQVRGARGLGSPVVRAGAVGVVLAGPWIPVPARVTGVEPGRRWDWTIGPVTMRHRVDVDGSGSLITVDLIAPPPIEATFGRAYAPLMRIALRRLARLADTAGARGRTGETGSDAMTRWCDVRVRRGEPPADPT